MNPELLEDEDVCEDICGGTDDGEYNARSRFIKNAMTLARVTWTDRLVTLARLI